MIIPNSVLGVIAGILGFLTLALPLIQAIIQKPWWPEHWKRSIQLGLSVVTGFVAYAATAGVSFHSLPELLLWVLGALTATNVGYAGPVGTLAKAIEVATTKAPYDDAEVTSLIDLEGKDGPEPDVDLPEGWEDDPSLNPQGDVPPEHAA